MKNIVELMLKYRQVSINIVGFIVVFCFLGFLTFQTTNHIPTQIKENHKEVNDRMDRLEDRMDRLEGKIDRLEDRMDRLEGKIDKNHRESNENHKELLRYLIEWDMANDKK